MSNSLVNVSEESAKGALSLLIGDFISTVILAIGYLFVARLLKSKKNEK